MKLSPANQTLIPALNAGKQRFAVSSPDDASAQLGQALRTVVSGAQLRSVTIVAARSDENVVVVQAEYVPESDSTSAAAGYAVRQISQHWKPSRALSYLSPVEQYARIQSGEARSAPLLDVRA